MEKIYQCMACGRLTSAESSEVSSLFDLLRFYSAPHLQVVKYRKEEEEFSNALNRTSIFVRKLFESPIKEKLGVEYLNDTEGVPRKVKEEDKCVSKSLLQGTKFKSGKNLIRAMSLCEISGDINVFLEKLGCRPSREICECGIKIQLLSGVEVSIYSNNSQSEPQVKHYFMDIACFSSEGSVNEASEKINNTIQLLSKHFTPID